LWGNLESVSFDIMIDDGLHAFEANSLFMKNSFHKLENHGFYIVEDIIMSQENLKNFHAFFHNFDASLIKLPIFGYNSDNCLAMFRPNISAMTAGCDLQFARVNRFPRRYASPRDEGYALLGIIKQTKGHTDGLPISYPWGPPHNLDSGIFRLRVHTEDR